MRKKPIVSRLQHQPRGRQYRFVPRPTDLKKQPVLPFQLNLAIVYAAAT